MQEAKLDSCPLAQALQSLGKPSLLDAPSASSADAVDAGKTPSASDAAALPAAQSKDSEKAEEAESQGTWREQAARWKDYPLDLTAVMRMSKETIAKNENFEHFTTETQRLLKLDASRKPIKLMAEACRLSEGHSVCASNP